MTGFHSFTEIVRQRVQARSEHRAYTFLPDDIQEGTETVTYSELDRSARSIAAYLQQRGLEGKRVLMLYPSSVRFIEAFVGCLYAGATAVPAPLPAGQQHHLERLASIVRDADVGLVLTIAEAAPLVRGLLDQAGLQSMALQATDGSPLADPDDWSMPDICSDTLAFLQYTSGSTRAPRGVMVSHRNLVHNETLIERAFSATPESVSGGWLPFYHDMGLIGQVLGPLFTGSSAVLMSPSAFLRSPYRWLEMIDRFGLEVSGGPNFCYDLCVRRVNDEQLARLDLSRWRVAYNGAEPIRAATLRSFAQRFEPAGFAFGRYAPCYGMAETTLFVAARPAAIAPKLLTASADALEAGRLVEAQASERATEIVSSGRTPGMDVRIVDPESATEVPDGSVGEIWIRGDSVASGYWRDPQASAETFCARTSDGTGGFVRSGDLGAQLDGELYVTGRRKEVVIVNGRNLYPQDIEHEAREAHPALEGRVGAAFGIDADGERLVVVHELRLTAIDAKVAAEAAAAVRARVTRNVGVRPGAVVLLAPRSVLRTTSGKIQRDMMRRAFLAGTLLPIHADVEPAVRCAIQPERKAA